MNHKRSDAKRRQSAGARIDTMSECEYARRLGAYHDGEMTAASAREMEQHVRDCPACAAELARLRALSPLLAAVASPALPPGALERIRRKVDQARTSGIRRFAEAMLGAAAAILLICSVWMLVLSGSPESDGTIPLWEMAAVLPRDAASESMSVEQQLATWTLQDLSWKNGHD
jgi:anti-sigma factor RsiW